VERGMGEPSDAEFAEERGCLQGADPGQVSDRAKTRGRSQLGTIGSGNHFLEAQYVERIHDAQAARAMGIEEDQVVVLLHCGSRGLGHQVCTDYLAQMGEAMQRYGIQLPDRQLACVPIQSPEGQSYLAAMRAAANFAWANRQTILHFLRGAFRRIFGTEVRLEPIYDVCHNIAKRERHRVPGGRSQETGVRSQETGVRSAQGSGGQAGGGPEKDVLVHRKGATRAFPPGHPELPPEYRAIGQPVLVPGSMGTASWILVGAPGSMQQTFGSVCHGAGRLMSRTAAKKGRNAQEVQKHLLDQGIFVRSETRDGILEEIPEAYKDVDEVIEVVDRAGLARKVARLRPIGVIKG
jgi:tRNA-splicing ligase RtcB (3'-phosphate/5'-hydroxy nucleic acid ligase)